MSIRSLAALMAVLVTLLSANVHAAGFLGDVARSINKSVVDAGKSIDKANQNVGRAVESAASPAARADIIRAQVAIQEAEAKQKEVEARFVELAVMSEKVDAEKQTLEKEKNALEAREKLFSMGFYASFTTSLLAIFGLVVKIPQSKLEKQLKLLEIQEKELTIKERAAKLAEKPNPSLNRTDNGVPPLSAG
jgi:hypothetical protein